MTEVPDGEPPIRLLLAQPSCLWRDALATVLAAEHGIRVVAEVSSTDEVLQSALRHSADVIVLDRALPGEIEVEELCLRLSRVRPDRGVVVLQDRRTHAGLGPMLSRLAHYVGVLSTDVSTARLAEGIREAARGRPVLDVHFAVASLASSRNPLTEREREVLRLAATGAPAKEIAAKLFLSIGTVRNYLSHILAKTGARTRIEAIRIAQEAWWI